MPLLIDRTIDALGSAPTLPTQGYNVADAAGVLLSTSEVTSLTQYTFRHYGLIDDERDGASTAAAGEWPEMDGWQWTRDGTAVQVVSLDGIQRWKPELISWVTDGGPPNSVHLKARLLSVTQWARLAQFGVLGNLSSLQIERLVQLSTDDRCPVRWFDLTTTDPEVANQITMHLRTSDFTGAKIATRVRGFVEIRDPVNFVVATSAQYTVDVNGPDNAAILIVNPPQAACNFITSDDGEADLVFTDVVGGSDTPIHITIRPNGRMGEALQTNVIFDNV